MQPEEAQWPLQSDTSAAGQELTRGFAPCSPASWGLSRQHTKVWREDDGWWVISLISAIPRKHRACVLWWSTGRTEWADVCCSLGNAAHIPRTQSSVQTVFEKLSLDVCRMDLKAQNLWHRFGRWSGFGVIISLCWKQVLQQEKESISFSL